MIYAVFLAAALAEWLVAGILRRSSSTILHPEHQLFGDDLRRTPCWI